MQNTLTVPLRDLSRQLGSQKSLRIDWLVPKGWKTEVLQLIPGQTIPIEVQLTSIEDGVLVQVQANGRMVGECVRCLDPISVPWYVDTAEVYFEPGKAPKAAEEFDEDIESEGDDLDAVFEIERDQIDLEPLLRDIILANAFFKPVCRPNCQGLCPHCGIRLDSVEGEHVHEFIDPRFAALAELAIENQDEEGDK